MSEHPLRRSTILFNLSRELRGLSKEKTRIVCTIGPKSNNVDTLRQLLSAGMCVVRMNTAHGDFDFHQSIIDNLRTACSLNSTICALLLDIKGPEIRTGKMKPNPARDGKKEWTIEKGQKFTFTTDKTYLGDKDMVATSYSKLPQISIPEKTRILIADGLIAFKVIEVKEAEGLVICISENAGTIGENKNTNVPDAVIDLPAVTEKDKEFVAFGVKNKIDFIAGSFIRKAADVLEIQALPGVKENLIQIISKIENQEGLDNFDEILEVTDGIMVARGDLGVEIPLPAVTTAQKMMINKCNIKGKPVITATQMLESMIVNPRPTRAEVADVFNAVMDGTDCVMLSGETANGAFPVESVKIMAEICIEAESKINYRDLYLRLRDQNKPNRNVAESISSSTVKTAWDLQAGMIVALSSSGKTATLVSKYRPHCPIICVTNTPRVARQLLVTRGLHPFLVDKLIGNEATAEKAVLQALRDGFISNGDYVVMVSGAIEGVVGTTSIMRVVQVDNNQVNYVIH